MKLSSAKRATTQSKDPAFLEPRNGDSGVLKLPSTSHGDWKTRTRFWQHLSVMTTILLLTLSNIFMTIAWYGHLKYRQAPLFKVIVISWLIAFAEYCFQVPANRIGSYEFTVAQLKTIQEGITLTVFLVFSVLYLKQPLKWNYLFGFAMMVAAVFVIFRRW